jgi:FkbM family methyltransferase
MYFDIGTNDPRNMNNTYLLYLNNYRGVCVEPNPAFHDAIKKYRPNDLLIPSGVATESKAAADFFIMDDPLLNTFSAEEANSLVTQHSRTIKKKLSVPLVAINEVFEKYDKADYHLILSLDVEGLDLVILKSLDFSRFKPSLICVENIEYSENLTGQKNMFIGAHLMANDYILYADTHINTIFIYNGWQKKNLVP